MKDLGPEHVIFYAIYFSITTAAIYALTKWLLT